MYLYKIAEGKNTEKIMEYKVEREEIIQKLITDNLYDLLQISLIKEYHNIPPYGEIDALGLDDDYRPVIIEFKKENKKDVLTQILDYCHWLHHNNDSYIQLVTDKRKDLLEPKEEESQKQTEISFKNFRAIIIGKDFSRRQKNAANIAHPNIELVDYKYFKLKDETILALDFITGEIKYGQEVYSIEHYFQGKNQKLKNLYQNIDNIIKKTLPEEGFDIYLGQKDRIAYKTGGRMFLRVYVHKNKIPLGYYLGEKAKEYEGKGVRAIHKSNWVYIDVANERDITDELFLNLLNDAYDYSS